ncbi:dioxygenase family protein [Roseinatronobacter bogoriensis]|uniref:6-chlorohydroxyquinol-1,2-dioxygenase n=1 Tax=Roseinatronobacter bogoriensis subsp. barguzinensis TaxID=441209 RepID=A0A2K8KB00_9RHOB|nr:MULTISPECIES: dioxygenase [Rhodobaca]ATX66629.1 6-chlorohydroxyquinol-1,2-dioxygenase [Rhodobaca barguzinensis]MBB4207808.1 protocatechuate 3,4-dioxygenase beta subunit [Rhodobaca bogoriensis DSM 18756]TDW39886.1 protocatechuate 3,4-dioxygenase beta subunit [Rhodobaca barguzinensis]TDY70961.1 protocatechuate 3,4-dioxygenase beta subunit [Rhodobaca bogoriensis DSM 18756]
MSVRLGSSLGAAPARAFAERLQSAPDQRLAQALVGLVGHLSEMVDEFRVSREEMRAILEFLTEVGETCSEHRQEWVLLADTLGLTSCVENSIARRPDGSTPNTMPGPFYRADAPVRANGASISLDGVGAPLTLEFRVTDLDSEPVSGARLEIWHANGAGLYENQDPDHQPEFNLRGIYTTDERGQVQIRTIRPAGYDVPSDGPVGRLMSSLGVSLKRPAHLHCRITAPGFDVLTTHVFDASDPAIAADPLFAVHPQLLIEFKRKQGAEWYAEYCFVLARQPRSAGKQHHFTKGGNS